MNNGDSGSILELLYKSLEKIVEIEFQAAESKNVTINGIRTEDALIEPIEKEQKTLNVTNEPIQIETESHGPIELMRQNRTTNAQDLSKNPKVP